MGQRRRQRRYIVTLDRNHRPDRRNGSLYTSVTRDGSVHRRSCLVHVFYGTGDPESRNTGPEFLPPRNPLLDADKTTVVSYSAAEPFADCVISVEISVFSVLLFGRCRLAIRQYAVSRIGQTGIRIVTATLGRETLRHRTTTRRPTAETRFLFVRHTSSPTTVLNVRPFPDRTNRSFMSEYKPHRVPGYNRKSTA